MRKITSAGPSITQSEIDLVSEAIREGWQDKMSLYTRSECSSIIEIQKTKIKMASSLQEPVVVCLNQTKGAISANGNLP